MPGLHRFSHEAMATTFEVIIFYEDKLYARQVALAAFDELDRLEQQLSRFVENSDISRIRNLNAGRSLVIGLPAFECLLLSARIYDETQGAFDITAGSLMNCWLDEDGKSRRPSREELDLARQRTGMDLVKLDESRYAVELMTDHVQLDLGGIGKGYAVDRMAALLRDWSIETALIHGGFSSVLALDPPPPATEGWPLTLSDPNDRNKTLARLSLKGRALSGSGLQKGRHIIDPRTAKPVEAKLASWACAPDAATADALSTAFMVMKPDEVKKYCACHPDVSAVIIPAKKNKKTQKPKFLNYGRWDKNELLF